MKTTNNLLAKMILLTSFCLPTFVIGETIGPFSMKEKAAIMRLAREALVSHFDNKNEKPKIEDPQIQKNLERYDHRVFTLFRKDTKARGCYSGRGGNLLENVVKAVRNTVRDSRYGGKLKRSEAKKIRLEVFVLLDRVEIKDKNLNQINKTIRIGIDSIQIIKGKKNTTFLNYVPITYNYSLERTLDRLCVKAKLASEEAYKKTKKAGETAKKIFEDAEVKLYRIPTVHFMESADPEKPIDLYRCNVFVPLEAVNRRSTIESIHLGGEWLLNSMRWNGAMEYSWNSANSVYSKGNNMIRQWMATNALWDVYQFTRQPRYRNAAKKNLHYNMQNYYKEETDKDIGYIYYRKVAKLGVAGLAIISLSKIDEEGKYTKELQRIRNHLLSQQRNDGFIESIYPANARPRSFAKKVQRYYIGEALLGLMHYYEKTKDYRLLTAVRKAFPYYRDFFREDGHPASVPWLTQAYYRAFRFDLNSEYVDFIFEMNDFLLGVQNGDGEPSPDFLGRFYDPERPEFGPPLSASTGVYLEGLVEAYQMALEWGDKKRAEKYRKAIILGIRSVMQLQFKGDNLYYIKHPDKTRGGIRSKVFGSVIRIDYTQHCVQAMIKAVNSLKNWKLE